MSAQDQVNGSSSRAPENNRIMCEQEFHFITTCACQRQRQVLKTDHRIVDTCQPEGLSVLFEAHAFVYQDSDSLSAKQVGNQGGVGPVVVVTQNSVDPMPRFQSTQHLRAGRCVLPLLGDVVAR